MNLYKVMRNALCPKKTGEPESAKKKGSLKDRVEALEKEVSEMKELLGNTARMASRADQRTMRY